MKLPRLCLFVAVMVFLSSFCVADSMTPTGNTFSWTGTLADPNDVHTLSFSLASPSLVSFQTWSYGGGTNAAGQSIPDGGFLFQELALYGPDPTNPLILELTQGIDTGCGPAVTDAYGYCGDLAGNRVLGPGTYTLAVLAFGNLPNGFSLADGFQGTGGFATYGDAITPDFAVDVALAPITIPEPTTLALLGCALLGIAGKLRRNN